MALCDDSYSDDSYSTSRVALNNSEWRLSAVPGQTCGKSEVLLEYDLPSVSLVPTHRLMSRVANVIVYVNGMSMLSACWNWRVLPCRPPDIIHESMHPPLPLHPNPTELPQIIFFSEFASADPQETRSSRTWVCFTLCSRSGSGMGTLAGRNRIPEGGVWAPTRIATPFCLR